MTRVYLAVGHGHRDSGSFDPGASAGRWNEQSAGDHIVAEAAAVLRDAGVTVKDEANQRDPNFPGTTKAANSWGADYVIAVHHDWTGAPPGAFGHWISGAGEALADDIQRAVGEAGFPLRDDWHKRRTDLYILKNTRAPCVLYEVGKIGQGDLDTPAELRAMGRALAAGIAHHVGIDAQPGGPLMALTDREQERLLDKTLKNNHALGEIHAYLMAKAEGKSEAEALDVFRQRVERRQERG